jgi:hypothetical protein
MWVSYRTSKNFWLNIITLLLQYTYTYKPLLFVEEHGLLSASDLYIEYKIIEVVTEIMLYQYTLVG